MLPGGAGGDGSDGGDGDGAGGGGGFGPPLRRDPEQVSADVAAGYISVDHAAEIYGVIVSVDGVLDKAETERRRAAMA